MLVFDSRLKELEHLIPLYSKMYYEGVQVDIDAQLQPISDEEFDLLVEELSELDPDHHLIQATGFNYELGSDKEKVPHCLAPITGINHKTKSDSFNKNLDHPLHVLTPKLDGTSIILSYKSGILTRALTRGTGLLGSNVLDIISQLSSVPKVLKLKIDLITRGELTNLADPEDGNIRNQSNGFIMRKDYTITEKDDKIFKFIPYRVLDKSLSKVDELQLLKDAGFIECPKIIIDNLNEIDWYSEKNNIIDRLVDFDGKILPIDGIVIEPNIESEQLNTNSPFNRKIIAFKLDSSSEETVVKSISWKLSQYGKYFPRVHFEKVVLDGANVTKCSGGSFSDLVSRGLGIGSKIVVVRSGGVIPYIKEVLETSDNIPLPENSYKKGAHLFSHSHSIEESRLIRNIFKRFIPHGYSTDLFNRFSSRYPDIMDSLYEFKQFVYSESLITTDREFITTKKQVDAINETFSNIVNYEINLIRLLSLCSINGLGSKLNKKLSYQFDTIESFMDHVDSGESISKYSNKLVQESVNNNLNNIKMMFEFFSNNKRHIVDEIFEFVEDEDSLKELPKVLLTNLTGSSMKKSAIAEKFKGKYLFVNEVKNADYVVYGKEGSSKYESGIKLNKTMIQVEKFINMELF